MSGQKVDLKMISDVIPAGRGRGWGENNVFDMVAVPEHIDVKRDRILISYVTRRPCASTFQVGHKRIIRVQIL